MNYSVGSIKCVYLSIKCFFWRIFSNRFVVENYLDALFFKLLLMQKIKKIIEIVKYSNLYKTNELLFMSKKQVDEIYYESLIPILKRFKTSN
jgi:hypothetical protein